MHLVAHQDGSIGQPVGCRLKHQRVPQPGLGGVEACIKRIVQKAADHAAVVECLSVVTLQRWDLAQGVAVYRQGTGGQRSAHDRDQRHAVGGPGLM